LRTFPLSRNDSIPSQLARDDGRRRLPSRSGQGGAGMTGMYEQVRPGIGHNQPDEYAEEKKHQRWERWAKKRTFVRALEGTYSHLYKALLEQKRVYSSCDVPWKGGPGQFGKSVISPQATSIIQSMESHIEAYAPGAYGQKHGHLNSAVFYVLKGRGHDVHDGRHIPWKAGDVMIVENGCVHQHFNDDPENEAILLVFKAKPLFLFMHLLFQKIVEWPPDKPPPGQESYKPPADI
jgi:mannose-6-phosphate isomerase-like protein (cupin superfamily)